MTHGIIKADLGDAAYRNRLMARLSAAIDDGASTLTDLCRAGDGAFPPAVIDVAREINQHSDVSEWPHRRWPEDALGTEDAGVPSMPEPHPIDFEWRFTAQTADVIAALLAQRGGRIGCLGAPSVFARLMHRGSDAILIDRNPGLRRHFSAAWRHRMWTIDLACDEIVAPADSRFPDAAREAIPLFDSMLLDPPWYVNHTLAWVCRALPWLRPGGRLLLSVFPSLVRPAAEEERDELFRALRSLGEVRPMPHRAAYTTPFFENETLSSFGLADLGQWRSGDLFEIIVPNTKLRVAHEPTAEAAWERVQLGRQVIAVRVQDETRLGAVRVTPINADGSFLLKSVSAREPVRQNVSLWTSRNRAAALSGTNTVLAFLRELEKGRSPASVLKELEREGDRIGLTLVLAMVGW